jgi:DNA-binding transcriptional ArsR family regulator
MQKKAVTSEAQHGQMPAGNPLQLEKFRQNAGRAAEFLKALAHENRLLLLCLLTERERSVTELENLLSLRQPAVSQQLARLRLDGLVSTRREGKVIYYRLNGSEIRGIVSAIHAVFCEDQDGKPAEPGMPRGKP